MQITFNPVEDRGQYGNGPESVWVGAGREIKDGAGLGVRCRKTVAWNHTRPNPQNPCSEKDRNTGEVVGKRVDPFCGALRACGKREGDEAVEHLVDDADLVFYAPSSASRLQRSRARAASSRDSEVGGPDGKSEEPTRSRESASASVAEGGPPFYLDAAAMNVWPGAGATRRNRLSVSYSIR